MGSTSIAVPAIVLNLFGGVFADKLDAKRLLGLTQLITAAVVLGLGILTQLKLASEWHVLVAAFLIGAVQAFDTPTRQSIFPRLIERKVLSSAVALNSAVWTGTRIFAPLMAGVIVGRASISTAIFVSAGGFLALSLVSQLLALPSAERAKGSVVREMMTGFRFIRGSPLFSLLIGMTFFNSMFGMSYVFLMPAFADDVFKVGAERIGLLLGAAGVGALGGIAIGASLGQSQYRGWVAIAGSGLFGTFLMLFALTSNAGEYGLSMAMLFLADMCISLYLIVVMTTLQTQVPDHVRGRVMGFYSITWSMIPLGGLLSSQIAHYRGAPLAVAIGGGLVVAFALGVALGSRRVRALGRLPAMD